MDPKIFPQEVDDKFVYNGRDKFAKLSAHAKGFLTRLLMTTDKVQGLIKTVKDTRDVLEDICKEETQSVQEKMLKENVEGHLRIARGSLHDVFFKISVKERMSYIAHSRELARTKEAKRRNTRSWIGQSKLSAVTLRAIQRRQEGLDSSVTQTANSEVKPKPEPKEEKKRKTWNIRVLKPQQGHTSPPLPDRTSWFFIDPRSQTPDQPQPQRNLLIPGFKKMTHVTDPKQRMVRSGNLSNHPDPAWGVDINLQTDQQDKVLEVLQNNPKSLFNQGQRND